MVHADQKSAKFLTKGSFQYHCSITKYNKSLKGLYPKLLDNFSFHFDGFPRTFSTTTTIFWSTSGLQKRIVTLVSQLLFQSWRMGCDQSNGHLDQVLQSGGWLQAIRSPLHPVQVLRWVVRRDVRSDLHRLDHVWSAVVNSVSQTRDQFGRRVVILKLGNISHKSHHTRRRTLSGKWDPDLIPVEEWFASTFVLLEVLTKVWLEWRELSTSD